MPSHYTHYRFGVEMLPGMPADIRKTVNRFRQLYDMGLHGPDLFFFYQPLSSGTTAKMASQLHMQTGSSFFARVCRNLRLDPSEGAEAYLYGALCHYCLDSLCHPYINEIAQTGEVTHFALESAFDRLLLAQDGKLSSGVQDVTRHMRLTAGECVTVARFYPGIKPNHVRDAVKSMALISKAMMAPEGLRRTILEKSMGFVAKKYQDMMLPTHAQPQYEALMEQLQEKYQQAKELFPELLEQLTAHLTYNATLGDEFSLIFG